MTDFSSKPSIFLSYRDQEKPWSSSKTNETFELQSNLVGDILILAVISPSGLLFQSLCPVTWENGDPGTQSSAAMRTAHATSHMVLETALDSTLPHFKQVFMSKKDEHYVWGELFGY